jgi:hypothetical protein
MKCLKCDKEAIWGNYCEDHAAETGIILGDVNIGRTNDIRPAPESPCPFPDLGEKPGKTSK